jgi:hypothetical protein
MCQTAVFEATTPAIMVSTDPAWQGVADAIQALRVELMNIEELRQHGHLPALSPSPTIDLEFYYIKQTYKRLKLNLAEACTPSVETSHPIFNQPLFSRPEQHEYGEHKAELEPIFTEIFPNWHTHSYEVAVLPLAKIARSTIGEWHGKWSKNQSWRPWNSKESHGSHNRLFTDQEEDELTGTIVSDYLELGRLFTGQTFCALATEKLGELGRDPATFICSDKFICGFKKRNGFSSRKCHWKRRDPRGTLEITELWMTRMQELMAAHQSRGTLEMVVNCDETAWRMVPSGMVTWAPIGQDEVTVRLDGNEKDSITVLASVTAGGTKLSLFAIAKGKTRRVEQTQLGSNPAIVCDHSPSGWSTIQTFTRYLDWLAELYRGKIAPDCPIDLVLDCYSVHRSQEIRDHATRLGIRLWFIPAGHTDQLQPLDRAVFGAIKAIFRRRFELERRKRPDHRITKSDAIQILTEIWGGLGTASITEGWRIYTDDFGPEEDAEDVDWEE